MKAGDVKVCCKVCEGLLLMVHPLVMIVMAEVCMATLTMMAATVVALTARVVMLMTPVITELANVTICW